MNTMLDNDDSYFIVLPSNVPVLKGIKQENKTSHYRTLLPRALQMDDRRSWEVALVEICYPQSWSEKIGITKCSYVYRRNRYNKAIHDLWLKVIADLNQSEDEKVKDLASRYAVGLRNYLKDGRKIETCSTSGKTENIADLDSLIQHLNDIRPKAMRGSFYKTNENRLGVQLHRFESIQIHDRQLSDIIRFHSGFARYRKGAAKVSVGNLKGRQKRHTPTNLPRDVSSTRISDKKTETLFWKLVDHYLTTPNANYYAIETATPVTLPPMASNIYVYSDIIAETYVGTQFVPLLRTVPIRKENRNKYVTEFFDSPRYLPLARSYIEQIEMRLCDEYGENVRFEWGHVVITLNFRRRFAPQPSLG